MSINPEVHKCCDRFAAKHVASNREGRIYSRMAIEFDSPRPLVFRDKQIGYFLSI